MPVAGMEANFDNDADTTYFNWSLTDGTLTLTIDSAADGSKLDKLDDLKLVAKPIVSADKITRWDLSGTLAVRLGIDNE
jgi:hypothetical protein